MARKDNILGLFQKTSSGENPLIGDPRYEKVRALGRGAYGEHTASNPLYSRSIDQYKSLTRVCPAGFVQLAIDKRTKEKVD